MTQIVNLWRRFKGNGKVYNFSRKWIWVVETDTNHPRGPAIAHKLAPNTKAPIRFDIDGFRRVDGRPIEGHSAWWKIWGHTTAKLSGDASGIQVDVIVKFQVGENEFGPVAYDERDDWGEPIRLITQVEMGTSGRIERFYVRDYGWLSKTRTIRLVAQGKIDNAVLVQPRNGAPYLRSRPDGGDDEGNFLSMVT